MAITLIRKWTEKGYNNLMFRTIQEIVETETGEPGARPMVLGTVTLVDEKLEPMSGEMRIEIGASEEEYHRDLRIHAARHKQLVTSHSTNPEWNPEGYSRNLEDD